MGNRDTISPAAFSGGGYGALAGRRGFSETRSGDGGQAQIGTIMPSFIVLSVKLVLIDWTFGSSTRAFFTVSS